MTYRESPPTAEDIERRRIDSRFEDIERRVRQIVVVGIVATIVGAMSNSLVDVALVEMPPVSVTPAAPAETAEEREVTLGHDHRLCDRFCNGASAAQCRWFDGGVRSCACTCASWMWADGFGGGHATTFEISEDR